MSHFKKNISNGTSATSLANITVNMRSKRASSETPEIYKSQTTRPSREVKIPQNPYCALTRATEPKFNFQIIRPDLQHSNGRLSSTAGFADYWNSFPLVPSGGDVVFSSPPKALLNPQGNHQSGGSIGSLSTWLDERLRNPPSAAARAAAAAARRCFNCLIIF